MTAYLDYNVFTSIEDGEFTLNRILTGVNDKIREFPFSAAHIQEADNITCKNSEERNEYITKRLMTIKGITNCLYLFHEYKTNKVYWLKEEPATVLETIRQVPFGKTAMRLFTNLFSISQKEKVRVDLGIETKEINNYKPAQVVEQLNSKLTGWGTKDTFIELIEKAISLHPDKNNFGLHNRIAAVLELLDLFGYWKDRETETSNYARLWDSNHIFFAAHSDYFISDDKRTRYKARVVYEIYGIKTKVTSSNGIE